MLKSALTIIKTEPALITGAVQAILALLIAAVVTLLAAFGVNGIQSGVVITLNGAIVAITALVLRQHVTPVATLNAQAHAL
jgi:hypothetical protein